MCGVIVLLSGLTPSWPLRAPTQAGNFAVYLGNGDGTFAKPAFIPFPQVNMYGSWSLAAGDFNKDGKPDLVVGNSTFNGAGRLVIYLNTSK